MLDRMAVLAPDWDETHAADPGITLVEALAYAADRVSYLQDAVEHRGLHRHRAQPHLAAPPRAAGRLPGQRRRERARLDLP